MAANGCPWLLAAHGFSRLPVCSRLLVAAVAAVAACGCSSPLPFSRSLEERTQIPDTPDTQNSPRVHLERRELLPEITCEVSNLTVWQPCRLATWPLGNRRLATLPSGTLAVFGDLGCSPVLPPPALVQHTARFE